MIPQAQNVISVEILGVEKPLLLRGPDARSFVRRFEKIWSRSGARETGLRVHIRHNDSDESGPAETFGAVLDNGSLRFGRDEALPVPAFREWMLSMAEGAPGNWPPSVH